MAPYEDRYDRRFQYPIGWYEVGEDGLIGPDLFYKSMEKVKIIWERMKTTQSHLKLYISIMNRDLDFKVYYWVHLNVSPMKGSIRSLVRDILVIIEYPRGLAM